MYAFLFAPGDFEVSCRRCSDGDDYGVICACKVVRHDVHADVDSGDELYSLGFKYPAPSVDDRLVQLEIWNAVTYESADVLLLFVHSHCPAATTECHRRGKTRGAGADYRNALAVFPFRGTRHYPALGKCSFDDQLLGLPNHHRFFVKLPDATGLAQRGAYPRSELREVAVDGEKLVCAAEIALHDGMVLVRNEVPQRTSGSVAEGDAAVLAAFCLLVRLFF